MWFYENKPFDEDVTQYVGYVYLITCIPTGKRYIGKKLFWMMKRKQVKGKVKRYKAESDWRTYWSSSDELKADVQTLGEGSFTREILHLCKSKGVVNYLELREQIDHRVLEYPDSWYNGWVMARITGKHIKALHKNNVA